MKCYNNESDVVYANGIDVEQKFIKNINGVTLAEYARENDQLNLLSDYYDDLLEAASQVHDLVNQTSVYKSNMTIQMYMYIW